MRWTPWSLCVLALLTACADDAGLGSEGGSTGTEGGTSDSTSATETSGEGSTTQDPAESETSETNEGTEEAEGTEEETTGPPEPFCGDGNVDPDEECDDGNDNDFDGCLSDCTEVELIESPELEWEYFEIPGTQCMDGSPAGFGVNYNPDSPDVMIYLEGGGACFGDACDFTAFSLPFVPPGDGIFSRGNDNNPVNDWTMIYVPYCTGDIHAGDGEYELGGQVRQFRGYSNITTYLQQIVPSFPAERVLLTGISAGGFGAALNATQVANAYGDQVELTVVDDSGPPLSNDVIAPCLQETFREVWNLDATVLAECPDCDPTDFATTLIEHVFDNYPNIQFGLFSNTADAIISTYMGAGWGNGIWNNCDGLPTTVPGPVYNQDLQAIRAAHMDEASTMYVFGIGHTALRVGYNITFADGVSLPNWIGMVIDGQNVHVGP